jgi:hypothetical protein
MPEAKITLDAVKIRRETKQLLDSLYRSFGEGTVMIQLTQGEVLVIAQQFQKMEELIERLQKIRRKAFTVRDTALRVLEGMTNAEE